MLSALVLAQISRQFHGLAEIVWIAPVMMVGDIIRAPWKGTGEMSNCPKCGSEGKPFVVALPLNQAGMAFRGFACPNSRLLTAEPTCDQDIWSEPDPDFTDPAERR